MVTNAVDVEITDRVMRVLDNGYVRLDEYMGSDLKVVNAARVSFKRKTSELRPQDVSLIRFLAGQGHTSPFRHNMVTFEISAPLMVMRQLQRYVIGGNHSDTLGGWSETSMRYISKDFSFYVPRPDQWRGAPENLKQGSSGHVDDMVGAQAVRRLSRAVDAALDNYEWAIKSGICAEQARLFIPAFGLYCSWYMTLSLQAVCHLFAERLAPDAMFETRQYARVMFGIVKDLWPLSVKELMANIPSTSPVDLEEVGNVS